MPQPQTFSEDLLNTLPQGSNPDKLTIDQVNIAMRASPVWNQWMQAHHIDPNNASLSGSDKNGLAKTLENNGFALPNGWEIDDAGNIREETHVGRNIMIAAAIAGAAFGGYALLAAYGAGAGAGAGGAAAAEGGTAAASSGAAAAGLGGVEGAATAGLGSSAAAGTLGSAAAGSSAMGLGAGSAAAGAGTLGATQIGTGMVGSAEAGAVPTGMGGAGAFDAAGNFIGDSSVTNEAGGSGIYSRIAQGAATASRGLAQGVAGASEAAAQNRARQENAGLTANGQNIQGQSAFENELLNRAHEEDAQRKEDLKNVYRSSVAQNPTVSPFSRSGAPKYSQQYMDTIGAVAGQGADRLKTAPAYSTNAMPTLRPYTPINPADVQGATGTNPSTLERIGQYAGPALSTYATLAQIYGW